MADWSDAESELVGANRTRWIVTLLVIVSVGVFGYLLYRESAGFKSHAAFVEGQEAEAAGDLEAALTHYQEAVELLGYWAADPALAAAYVGLYERRVSAPATVESVEAIRDYVDAYNRLRPSDAVRAQRANVVGKLGTWVDEIGLETEEAAVATRVVAALGLVLDESNAGLRTTREQATLMLGAEAEAEWPADALALYASVLPSERVQPATNALLERLLEWPQMLASSEREVRRAIEGAPAELRAGVEAALLTNRAWDEDEERAAALLEEGGARLDAWVLANPGDQLAVAAVAHRQRNRGQSAEGLATLEALGLPGETVDATHVLRAELLVYAERSDEALMLLRRYTDAHLSDYVEAATTYDRRLEEKYTEIENRAERGDLPRSVMDRLLAIEDQNKRGVAFMEYADERLRADAELRGLADQISAYSDAVSASMLRGSVALELAVGESGEARQTLLLEAEASFLAIRGDAGDTPAYRVLLGQVYHRLGRPEEGDAEFTAVVNGFEPVWDLAVASAYRELGLADRARTVVNDVVARNPDAEALATASVLLAALATTPEEQLQAMELAPDVAANRRLRDENRAFDLMSEGDLDAAAEIFLRIAEEWDAEVGAGGTGANNAGVAYQNRYGCTGDMADLTLAIEAFERAGRLDPGSAIVAENAATAQLVSARTTVLAEFVDLEALGFDSDLEQLVPLLLRGSERERVRSMLMESPLYAAAIANLRRALTLSPGNTALFETLRQVLVDVDDAAGVERLHTQLLSTGFERTADESLASFQRGEMDELVDLLSAADVAYWKMWLADANTDAVTLDAGRALLLSALYQRLRTSGPEDAIAAAFTVLGEMRSSEWGIETTALAFAASNAVARAAESNAPLAEAWSEMRLLYRPGAEMALRLSEQSPEFAAALRAEPSMAAVRVAMDALADDPTLSSWAAAAALGDRTRMASHAAFRDDATHAASNKLRFAMSNTNDMGAAWQAELWAR